MIPKRIEIENVRFIRDSLAVTGRDDRYYLFPNVPGLVTKSFPMHLEESISYMGKPIFKLMASDGVARRTYEGIMFEDERALKSYLLKVYL